MISGKIEINCQASRTLQIQNQLAVKMPIKFHFGITPLLAERSRLFYTDKIGHDVTIQVVNEALTATKINLKLKSPFFERIIDTMPGYEEQVLPFHDFPLQIVEKAVELIEVGEAFVDDADLETFEQCITTLELIGVEKTGKKRPHNNEEDEPVTRGYMKLDSGGYLCLVCNKVLKAKIDRHYESMHLNIEYPCRFCHKKFKASSIRKDHLRQVHGISERQMANATIFVPKITKEESP